MSPSTQAFENWRRRNPLRHWREKQWPPLSRAALARQMAESAYRITPITILRWESGEYDVPEAAMAVLARITGIADLRARWTRWQKARQPQ